MYSSRFVEYRKTIVESSGVARDVESLLSQIETKLDQLYNEIVTSPVTDLGAALDKLWFAHHCLTEEDDIKEAANMIFQVCRALENFVDAKKPDDLPQA